MTHPLPSTTQFTPFVAFPPFEEAVAYFTAGTAKFSIRPGEPSSALNELQKTFRVRQWAVVSAANPHGLTIATRENQRRHGQLLASALAENLPVIEVELRWQGYEPKLQALWIGGIPLHQAQELARDFAQTKLFYGDSERAPAIHS